MELRDRLQSTLGHAYTLERELGGGGMSRVFVARETALNREVVVKVLPPDLIARVNVDRFKREILLAATLQHPHIVHVLSAGEMEGIPYYTMPLVQGESLRARLARGGALPVGEAVSILRDVAKAIAYAHDRGVVHRDIKPDNVLLTGGVAVVTDFGIAKALSASRTDGDLSDAAPLTQMGTSLGTPAYMAPEQAAADPSTDHRADIYAFGVMAYEMLVGRPPFHGKTPQKLLAAQMGERPQPITELRADIPPVLAILVMRCLEKGADDRPQSAGDLSRVLETVTPSGGSQEAMASVLLGGEQQLWKALGIWAAAFIVVAVVAKAAIVTIGLPSWVAPGAIVVMLLGLPAILFTAFVHRTARTVLTKTPTLTPGGGTAPHGTLATLAVKASPWVNWRRTWLGGAAAVAGFIALVGVYMLLRALGIGPAGSLLAAGKLNARAPILVTDFAVTGADSTIGTVVTEAVRANFAQSSAVSLVTPANLAAALQRMKRPPTSRVDIALAHDLAAREGIKAIIDGTVTALGDGFVLVLRLVPADSGNELASFRTTVKSSNDIISAVDELSRSLRGKIGESLKAVQGAPPLERVTTSSIEALRKYSAGARAADVDGDYVKAARLLREAVAIDSTFAMAWRKLAVAFTNNRSPRSQVDSAISQAFKYRDRLNEPEKYAAIAYYYSYGPGRDRAKAISAYETLLERGDSSLLNNLAILVSTRREYARAESLYAAAIRTNQDLYNPYTNIVSVQVALGKMREADASTAFARSRFPGNPRGAQLAAGMLYQHGDLDGYAKALDSLRAMSSAEQRILAGYSLSALDVLRGRIRDSDRVYRDAAALDSAQGGGRVSIADSSNVAFVDAWIREQPERAVQRLDAALGTLPLGTLPIPDRPYFAIATTYAVAHRPDRARAMLTQYANEVKDTAVIRDQQPQMHGTLAEIALAEGRPRDAISEFRLSVTRPDGPATGACDPCVYFDLGRAFDLANEPDSAIAMLEKYIATPSLSKTSIQADPMKLAGTYKRLGELYEAKRDRVKAMSYYSKFIELWKNADPELQPKVEEAKRKLAALQRVGG
jgi:tetratricopeptide (TPR) repeat protein